MLAKNIMVTNLVTAKEDELVSDVFAKMRNAKLRMLPVLDNENRIVGVLSTFSVMEHVVPEYLVSGDLNQISYAPDMGLLRKHYDEISSKPIRDIMNREPLLVHETESLLSVAATLTSYGRHEYAMVIDKSDKFLGVISAGDILESLSVKVAEVSDA
jgi:CBS domain-containing protein